MNAYTILKYGYTRLHRYALTRQITRIWNVSCLDICVIVKVNIRSPFNYHVSFELFDKGNMEGKKWHRGEHVGARARSVMRKKAYRVTFSIRDACDVRSFRLSFLIGLAQLISKGWFDWVPIYHCVSYVFNE